MLLGSSFAILFQEFAVAMTAPSFQNLMCLTAGWLLLAGFAVLGAKARGTRSLDRRSRQEAGEVLILQTSTSC